VLLVVDPAGEDEMEQLPRLKNEVHGGPVAVEENGLARSEIASVNGLKSGKTSDHKFVQDFIWGSSEYFHHTPVQPRRAEILKVRRFSGGI